MGTDTKALRRCAEWMKDDEAEASAEEIGAWARVCSDAVDEIDVLRETAKRLADEAEALRKGGAGPSVEERLEKCRDRAVVLVGGLGDRMILPMADDEANAQIAARVEAMAHALLAAERPASPPSNEEATLYNKGHRHGQVTGARDVLTRFDHWITIIDFNLPLKAEDMREWSAAVRREMGLGEG